MPSTLSPQATQKIKTAYKQFRSTVRTVTQKHRATVTNLSLKIDEKHIADLKKKISL